MSSAHYTTNQQAKPAVEVDYSKTKIVDFLRGQNAHVAAFVQTKLALASESMIKLGFTSEKVAQTIGLASGASVLQLIQNWGSAGSKRGRQ